jgi:hypothetical protein
VRTEACREARTVPVRTQALLCRTQEQAQSSNMEIGSALHRKWRGQKYLDPGRLSA